MLWIANCVLSPISNFVSVDLFSTFFVTQSLDPRTNIRGIGIPLNSQSKFPKVITVDVVMSAFKSEVCVQNRV